MKNLVRIGAWCVVWGNWQASACITLYTPRCCTWTRLQGGSGEERLLFFFFWWGKRVLFSSQERVFPDGWSIYESVWGFIPLLLRSFEWTMFFTSTKGTWGSPLEWGILPIAGDPSHRIFDPLPPANPQEETGQGSLYSSRRSYSPVWAGT